LNKSGETGLVSWEAFNRALNNNHASLGRPIDTKERKKYYNRHEITPAEGTAGISDTAFLALVSNGQIVAEPEPPSKSSKKKGKKGGSSKS
jgi:hypothetical protein